MKYSFKDKFDLFLGSPCVACKGMIEKAEQFAYENNMVFTVYENSKEVPGIPAVRYPANNGTFIIVGTNLFKKLLLIVRAKREGLI